MSSNLRLYCLVLKICQIQQAPAILKKSVAILQNDTCYFLMFPNLLVFVCKYIDSDEYGQPIYAHA